VKKALATVLNGQGAAGAPGLPFRGTCTGSAIAKGSEFIYNNPKMPPHLLPLIVFDLNTGLRKGELISLKWPDVNYESVQILISAENAKYNRSRYVDLNKYALAVLKSLPIRSEYVFCDRNGKPFKNLSVGGQAGSIERLMHSRYASHLRLKLRHGWRFLVHSAAMDWATGIFPRQSNITATL